MNEFLIAIGKLIKEKIPKVDISIPLRDIQRYWYIRVILKSSDKISLPPILVYDDRIYLWRSWREFDIADPQFNPDTIVEWITDEIKDLKMGHHPFENRIRSNK